MAKKIAAYGLGLMVLAVGIYWIGSRLERRDGEITPFGSVRPGLTVPDQPPGSSVDMPQVTVEDSGFAVVQLDEAGPGRIIGVSSYLKARRSGALEIRTDSPLTPGYYYAALRRDDGDRDFEESQDPPAVDKDGEPLLVRFLVSAEGF